VAVEMGQVPLQRVVELLIRVAALVEQEEVVEVALAAQEVRALLLFATPAQFNILLVAQ
jgi:hypothetical protein